MDRRCLVTCMLLGVMALGGTVSAKGGRPGRRFSAPVHLDVMAHGATSIFVRPKAQAPSHEVFREAAGLANHTQTPITMFSHFSGVVTISPRAGRNPQVTKRKEQIDGKALEQSLENLASQPMIARSRTTFYRVNSPEQFASALQAARFLARVTGSSVGLLTRGNGDKVTTFSAMGKMREHGLPRRAAGK